MNRDSEELLRLAKQGSLLDSEEVQKFVLTSAASNSEHLQDAVSKAVLSRSVSQHRYPFETDLSYGSAGLGSTGGRPQLSQEDLSKHLLVAGWLGSWNMTQHNMLTES